MAEVVMDGTLVNARRVYTHAVYLHSCGQNGYGRGHTSSPTNNIPYWHPGKTGKQWSDDHGSVSAIQRGELHIGGKDSLRVTPPALGPLPLRTSSVAFHEDVSHSGSGSADGQKNSSTLFHPHQRRYKRRGSGHYHPALAPVWRCQPLNRRYMPLLPSLIGGCRTPPGWVRLPPSRVTRRCGAIDGAAHL